MKNNTKLIIENWRKFLKEAKDDLDPNGISIDPAQSLDPSDMPSVEDPGLSGQMSAKDRNEALKSIYCELVEDMDENEVDKEIERLSQMNLSDDQLNRLAYGDSDVPYAGDDLEYTEEDAYMAPEEREEAGIQAFNTGFYRK